MRCAPLLAGGPSMSLLPPQSHPPNSQLPHLPCSTSYLSTLRKLSPGTYTFATALMPYMMKEGMMVM